MAEAVSGENQNEIVAAAIDDDSELRSMRDVLGALVPLKREARLRVLDYVLRRLGISVEGIGDPTGVASVASYSSAGSGPAALSGDLSARRTDIRSLKTDKAPRSANEMAALVAFYLSEVAPPEHRKSTINASDIGTYFKQASFKLPSSARMTLTNAKNAGYLEASGELGQYRLNPVGYNLVVHGLPSSKTGSSKSRAQGQKSKAKTTKRNRRAH